VLFFQYVLVLKEAVRYDLHSKFYNVAVVMNRMTRQVLKPAIRRRRTSGRNRQNNWKSL